MARLVVLLLLAIVCSVWATDVRYVDPSSTCTNSCGSSSKPYPSIKSALANPGKVKLVLMSGTYKGSDNTGLYISSSISISSQKGASKTTIDCEGKNYGIRVYNVGNFVLSGVTMRNCTSSSTGGALALVRSYAYISNVIMVGNSAQYGGAMYVSGGHLVTLVECVMWGNTATAGGGGLYAEDDTNVQVFETDARCNAMKGSSGGWVGNDVACKDDDTDVYFSWWWGDYHNAGMGVTCNSGCSVTRGLYSMCGHNQASGCDYTNINSTYPINGTDTNNTNPNSTCTTGSFSCPPNNTNTGPCGDGTCDYSTESCLNCPADCPRCAFNGGKIVSYNASPTKRSSANVTSITSVVGDLENFMPTYTGPVSATISGYFKVPVSQQYGFSLHGTNVGARLYIDNRLVLDSYYRQKLLRTSGFIQIDASLIHLLRVELFSYERGNRSLSIFWQPPTSDEFIPFTALYYSQNVCFDGIKDPAETDPNSLLYCPADVLADSLSSLQHVPYCGDGICQETDPNTCIQDCYATVTTTCSPLASPSGHIPAGFWTGDDTIGTLITNQILYHLPGVEHMTFGIDIVTGNERLAPLFYFGYCEDTATNIIQDMYRGNVYNIPPEIHAEPFPRCSYSAKSTSYSSSSELQQSMMQASSLSVSAGGGVNFAIISAEASAAYSQSKSVTTASELETRRSGSVVVTEVRCTTSKVTINQDDLSFHPVFVADVAAANTTEKMLALLYKYGTHYYKEATLGGKLQQISTVDSSFESQATSSQVEEAATYSFSASVSASTFGSASATADYASSSSMSESELAAYDQSTSRSTVITFGGAPGAYAPDSDPSSFGDWAQNIDLLPVAIDQTLGRIADLIPHNWVVAANETFEGLNVRELWTEAEILYYTQVQIDYAKVTNTNTHYTLIWNFVTNEYDSTHPFIYVRLFGQRPVLVLDQYGPPGTAGPLRFDPCFSDQSVCNGDNPNDCAAICHPESNPTSPIEFTFVGPAVPTISPVVLRYANRDDDSLDLHTEFQTLNFSIMDYSNSRFYTFYPLVNSTPIYDHDNLQLHFIATKTDNAPVSFWANNELMGFINVEIIIYGKLGQIQVVVETTEPWPQNPTDFENSNENPPAPAHIFINIPKGGHHIGPIIGVQMKAGIPQHIFSNIQVGGHNNLWEYINAIYIIKELWIVQTFCPDNTNGLKEGCSDRNSGLSYVYAAPSGFSDRIGPQLDGFTTSVYSIKNRVL